MTMWDGMPFTVEWKGDAITVMVSREAIEDLGRLKGSEPDSAYIAIFDKYSGSILDGVVEASRDKSNFDRYGRLYVRGKDISALREH